MKLFLGAFAFLALSVLNLSSANAAGAVKVQAGDIIGLSEIKHDPSTVIFEAATSSRFGHVGVILKDGNKFVVYEAAPPVVKVTPLKEFLAYGNYAIIRRDQPLTAADIVTLKTAADKVVAKGTPYNHSMVMTDSSLNCSEFVFGLFNKAQIPVGRIEKIRDQNVMAFKGMFLKMLEQSGQKLDMDGDVVTPVSIMKTQGWSQIAGTLSLRDDLTDLDLYNQWDQEGLLGLFDYAFGVSSDTLKQLATP